MSFGLNNDNNLKAHSAYKDGGGLGGGGMYFKNKGKEKNNSKKDEQEDMFEYKDSKKEGEISLSKELSDSEIPNDSLYNKFVNWYRNIGK